jgi:hypothetical protein
VNCHATIGDVHDGIAHIGVREIDVRVAEQQKSHRTSSSKITAPSPMERNGTASTRSAMGKRFDPGWMIATPDSPRSPRADVKIDQAINDLHGIPGMSAAPIPVTNGAAFGFNW